MGDREEMFLRTPESVRSGWRGGHLTGRADLLCGEQREQREQRVWEGKGVLACKVRRAQGAGPGLMGPPRTSPALCASGAPPGKGPLVGGPPTVHGKQHRERKVWSWAGTAHPEWHYRVRGSA